MWAAIGWVLAGVLYLCFIAEKHRRIEAEHLLSECREEFRQLMQRNARERARHPRRGGQG